MKTPTTRTRARAVALITALAATLITVPAGPAAATGHLLTGIEYRDHFESLSTSPRKTAVVECTGSKYVVGTGFTIVGGDHDIRIESVVPSAHSVEVIANQDEDGSSTSWGLTARATCANSPPGWEIVSDPSPTGVGPSNTAVTTCDSDRVVIGTGFDLPDTGGQLTLTDLNPLSRTVSAVAYEDDTGLSSSWRFSAYAICSYPLDGLQILSGDRETGSATQNELIVCPTPTYALGAAGKFDGGEGNVRFRHMNAASLPGENYSSPTDLNFGITTGEDDDNGSPLANNLIGTTICAKAQE